MRNIIEYLEGRMLLAASDGLRDTEESTVFNPEVLNSISSAHLPGKECMSQIDLNIECVQTEFEPISFSGLLGEY